MPSIVSAQTDSDREVLIIDSGSVFEILAFSEVKDPIYSWVLTKDSELIQGSTDQLFRTRFTQNGNYVLIAKVYEKDLSEQFVRTFFIRVNPSSSVTLNEEMPLSRAILKNTVPARDEKDRIILNEDKKILFIEPIAEQSNLVLDFDNTIDSNNDGITNNDQYVRNTFFAQQGTPLYLWLVNEELDLNVTLSNESLGIQENLKIQSSDIAAADDAEAAEKEQIATSIIQKEFSSNTFGFSIDATSTPINEADILLLWNFGDGKESLLDRPIHTYTSTGEFLVTAKAISLSTGENLQEYTGTAIINSITDNPYLPTGTGGAVTSSSSNLSQSSSVSSSSSREPEQSNSSNTELLWFIVKILLIIGASLGVGFLIVYLVHKFRKMGGVHSIIQKSEDTLLKDKPQNSMDTPAPMELPDIDTTSTTVVVDDNSISAPNKEENIKPSWLTDAENTVSETNNTTNKNQANSTENEVKPSWLQTNETATATDATSGNDAPAPKPEPLPSWLQQPNQNFTNNSSSKIIDTDKDENLPIPPKETTPESTDKTDVNAPIPAWLDTSSSATTKVEPIKVDNSTTQEPTMATEPEVVPDWLKPMNEPATSTPTTTQNSPAPLASKTKNNQSISNSQNDRDSELPPWLQTSTTKTQPSATNEKPNIVNKTKQADEKGNKEQSSKDNKETNEDIDNNTQDDSLRIDPSTWDSMTEEEQEKEKKRLKRKRYRKNKKKNKSGDTSEDATKQNFKKESASTNSATTTPQSQVKPDQAQANTQKSSSQSTDFNNDPPKPNDDADVQANTEAQNSKKESASTNSVTTTPQSQVKPDQTQTDAQELSQKSTSQPANFNNGSPKSNDYVNEQANPDEQNLIPMQPIDEDTSSVNVQPHTPVESNLQDIPMVDPNDSVKETDPNDDVQFIIRADGVEDNPENNSDTK